MSRRAYTILWDLHAWAGVIFALFLFVMFFTGAFVLFRGELHLWADPAASWSPPPGSTLGQKIGELVRDQPEASWRFDLREQASAISAVTVGSGSVSRIDPVSGALAPERSQLERILFYLHFFYQLPYGFYFTGFIGVALVLLGVSGIWLQWRHLPDQLFRFRPKASSTRLVWTDLHKVLGTLGLPFQFLFAITGAVICLSPLLLLAHQDSTFRGDRQALAKASARLAAPSSPSGSPATHDWDALIARARAEIPGFVPTSLRLVHPGDEQAVGHLYGYAKGIRGFAGIALQARDGAVLDKSAPGQRGPAAEIASGALGLHFVKYGGSFYRWLNAFLSLAGAATACSGVAIWLSKRQETRSHRWLLRLTVGSSAGLAAATSGLFAANRFLPWELPSRPAWENALFFGGWLAATLVSFFRRDARAACRDLLYAAGACSLAAVAADRFRPLPPETLGVQIALAVLGLAYLWSATRLHARANVSLSSRSLPSTEGV